MIEIALAVGGVYAPIATAVQVDADPLCIRVLVVAAYCVTFPFCRVPSKTAEADFVLTAPTLAEYTAPDGYVGLVEEREYRAETVPVVGL
jgi:hypothetical protein